MPVNPQKLMKFLITMILLGVFGFFLAKYHKELYIVREISVIQFLSLFVLVVISVGINGSKLKYLTRFFNLSLEFKEWFGLSSITTTLNNVLFKAGSLVTSNYLKRKHQFPYMSFVGSLGADQLILLFTASVTGGIVSCWLVAAKGAGLQPLAGVYLFAAIILLLFMRGRFRMKNRDHWILNALVRAVNALNRILENRTLFFTLCAHNLVLIVLTSLRFYVACQVLGLDVALEYCFLFSTVVILVSVLPIFQSDVGARELAVAFFSQLVGIGFNEGLLATLIDRLFVLLWTVLLAGMFKHILVPEPVNRGRDSLIV
ncbi:MAG: lysylphosphatidylglycerol synthase domain-containing protein [Nitrospinaceae bacterium]